jgi:glycerophosphoryl diester phosphodiesterase
MKKIAEYADGIGPDYHMLVETDSTPDTVKLTPMTAEAHASNMVVHPFTVRADDLPKYAKNVDSLYKILYQQAHVDGLFTDFPDKAVSYLEHQQTQPQQ